jgi:hypothetical protein
VAPPRFDRARIASFLALAGDTLDGEWLLIGGAAAAAWFAPSRTTEDIDMVGLGGTQAERFALMDLATAAAVPIEAVNSAADFFVRRIAGWRDQLELLHRGARATIYRPSPTLFLLLKIGRLTAVDLEDCLAMLAHTRASRDTIDLDRVLATLSSLPETDDTALKARRDRLDQSLRAPADSD